MTIARTLFDLYLNAINFYIISIEQWDYYVDFSCGNGHRHSYADTHSWSMSIATFYINITIFYMYIVIDVMVLAIISTCTISNYQAEMRSFLSCISAW